MFGDSITLIALIGLATLSAGAIAYALLFRTITSEQTVAKRLGAVTTRTVAATKDRRASVDAGARRKSIQDSMKEMEARQKAESKKVKTPPLSVRFQRAGLNWSKRFFLIFCILCGVAFAVVGFFLSGKLYIAVGIGGIGGVGFPRWLLSYLGKKRVAKFLEELPNAVDVIIRGIKSGLPLNDCMRVIASESAEPVKGEFRQIMETQQLGVPIADAVGKLFERVPAQEVNFFATVIAIQAKAGGNLSEALSNLSRVLRDRKKMRAKISAMSMEAKSSAGIIGSLPFIVSTLVYLTSPSYIMLLFNTQTGNIILVCGLLYMFVGILVMRKMINFDF
jgi:tight adherence protein B